jgi:hypothetical protein
MSFFRLMFCCIVFHTENGNVTKHQGWCHYSGIQHVSMVSIRLFEMFQKSKTSCLHVSAFPTMVILRLYLCIIVACTADTNDAELQWCCKALPWRSMCHGGWHLDSQNGHRSNWLLAETLPCQPLPHALDSNWLTSRHKRCIDCSYEI